MGTIGFCPLAKWDGEFRKYGPNAGEGNHPSCTSAARKDGDTPAFAKRAERDGLALAKGGRNRPHHG